MEIPKSFTTVTPLSKLIALCLVILLPILGFLLGVFYQKNIQPKQIYVVKKEIVEIPQKDTSENMTERCGDSPIKSYELGKDRFDRVYGPHWSPDCRHIAWSIDQFTVGGNLNEDPDYIGPGGQQPLSHEGLFLYNDLNKKIERIYIGENRALYPVFDGWKDRATVLFHIDETKYQYDLNTDEAKILNEST